MKGLAFCAMLTSGHVSCEICVTRGLGTRPWIWLTSRAVMPRALPVPAMHRVLPSSLSDMPCGCHDVLSHSNEGSLGP
jgi:hypothetical protein